MRVMVNVEARREMARLMRKFARGAVTVDEFEARAWELSELDSNALDCMIFAWYFYDDFRTEHLVGQWKLTQDGRRVWAKWVLFLMTTEDYYEEPDLSPSVLPYALFWVAYLAVAIMHPILALISYPVFYIFMYFDVVGSIWSAIRPPKALPEHSPFSTSEDFQRAIALQNPFATAA